MKLIKETRPEFMYSLHNAGFGGAYWYISNDIPALYDDLRASAVKQGIPLNLGEPEEPFITKFSPAIFKNMTIGEAYDFIEKFSGEKPSIKNGTSSSDYASTITDCITLMTELPYFFDSRIEDRSNSEMTRKEAILKNVQMSQAHFARLGQLLNEIRVFITDSNPFVKLVDEVIQYIRDGSEAKLKWAESNPEFAEQAKIAEVFDNLYGAKFYNGLYFGLTVRTIEHELNRLQQENNRDEEAILKLKKAHEKGAKLLKKYCKELERELDYSFIPIQKLVRIQVESGLNVANYIRENR